MKEYVSRIGFWGTGAKKIIADVIKEELEKSGAVEIEVRIVKGIIYILSNSEKSNRDLYLLWLNMKHSDVDFGSPEEMRIIKASEDKNTQGKNPKTKIDNTNKINKLKEIVEQKKEESIGGYAFIPDVRDRMEIEIGMKDGEFDILIEKLFKGSKCKIQEGSGDRGFEYHGRNFMFLKMK